MKKTRICIIFSITAILGLFLIVFLLKAFLPQDENNDTQGKFSDYNNINYTQSEDGTWQCNGVKYKYYLELDGKWPETNKNGSAVILSNTKEVDFDDITNYLLSSQQGAHNSSDWILIRLKTND